MTAVPLTQQIDRVSKRLRTVEHSLTHCRLEERPTIERERDEWNAVLATLVGIRAANQAAGFVEHVG